MYSKEPTPEELYRNMLPAAPTHNSYSLTAQVHLHIKFNHRTVFTFFLHTNFTVLFQMSTSSPGVHESLETT